MPIPTKTRSILSRNHDHVLVLAEALANKSGLETKKALGTRKKTSQVGKKRSERLAQLKDAFFATDQAAVAGRRILLFDDVATTGATLEAAARALRSAGAESVVAVVLARA